MPTNNSKQPQNLSVEFQNAGFLHHALTGQAPEGSSRFYEAAVGIGSVFPIAAGLVIGAADAIRGIPPVEATEVSVPETLTRDEPTGP